MTQSFAGPLWHVAMVESPGEIRVAQDIHDELGFPVFVPAERIVKVRRGRKVDAAQPLFPGYIFPCVHPYRQDWQRLLDIDGVLDVLEKPTADSARTHPGHVPAPAIEALRKLQECGAFDRTKVEPDGFAIGDGVRVGEGPFAGLNAEITGFIRKMQSCTARKRAKLLVQFLGRMTSTEIDVTALEKI